MRNLTDTLYTALREALGRPTSWIPTWATVLSSTHTETGIEYQTHPAWLTNNDMTEINALIQAGWQVAITSPRLNRLRVTMTQEVNS